MIQPSFKEILIAGLLRFANEGYYCWSKENLTKIIQQYSVSRSLEDYEIQKLLRQLENDGLIKLNFTDFDYLEVIKND